MITRRSFIKSVLVFASTIFTGVSIPGCLRYPQKSTKLLFFSHQEYFIMRKIASRMLPLNPSPDELGVADSIDKFLISADKNIQSQFRQLLAVFECGTFIFNLKLMPFSQLPAQEQDKYMNSWAASRIGFKRQGFMALKKFCMSNYYMNDQTWNEIRYKGPWHGRKS